MYIQRLSHGNLGALLMAETPNDVTIVGVSSGNQRSRTLFLQAFLASCKPDRSFGDAGDERISFPGADASVFDFAAMSSETNGDILIGASEGYKQWTVVRLLPDGHVDHHFGHGGWLSLSPPTLHPQGAGVTSIAEMPSGDIVVGGNDGNAHCCVQALVTRLTANGKLDSEFGSAGWVKVFPEGSYTALVTPQPSGDVAVTGQITFMGCGETYLTMLSSSGSVVQPFQTNLVGAWKPLTSEDFVNGMVVNSSHGSLELVATGSKRCTWPPPFKQFGLVERINSDGLADSTFGTDGKTYFTANASFYVAALSTSLGGVIAITGPSNYNGQPLRNDLALSAFLGNGSANLNFGNEGRAVLAFKPVPHDRYLFEPTAVISPTGDLIIAAVAARGVEMVHLVA